MMTYSQHVGKQPAFPADTDAGIDIRTWLAGLAMQGLCAVSVDKDRHVLDAEEIAAEAVATADALLRHLFPEGDGK